MRRTFHRGGLCFVGLLAASWVAMATTHELGHLIGGWCGGATLVAADLVPWRLPYSLHAPDPHPRLTLWAGPILGIAIPMLIATILRRPWSWFVADFCLLANGSYLALAWLSGDRYLDTPRMLAAGTSPIAIGVFCVVTIAIGYYRFRDDCIRQLS